MNISPHSELIDALGGTAAVARLCCVSPQAVSKWRNSGIPPARLMYLQLAYRDVCSEFGIQKPVATKELPDAQPLP